MNFSSYMAVLALLVLLLNIFSIIHLVRREDVKAVRVYEDGAPLALIIASWNSALWIICYVKGIPVEYAHYLAIIAWIVFMIEKFVIALLTNRLSKD